MKKYLLFLLPFAVLALHSCEKVAGTVIEGTNGTSATYQPLTAGSTWTYRTDYTSQFGSIDTDIVVMSAKTLTINSKVYQQAYSYQPQSPSNIDTGYYYASNHSYSIMQPLGSLGSGNAYTFELLYLKDNLPVGGTWTSTMSNSVLGPLTLNGKIVEKGISKTVAGKKYTNVIHTNIRLTLSLFGTISNNNYEMYIAQGVGLIRIESTEAGGLGMIPQDLISYSIK